MSTSDWIIVAVVLVIVAVLLGAVFKEVTECNERGGVLVRGVVGYSCVERR